MMVGEDTHNGTGWSARLPANKRVFHSRFCWEDWTNRNIDAYTNFLQQFPDCDINSDTINIRERINCYGKNKTKRTEKTTTQKEWSHTVYNNMPMQVEEDLRLAQENFRSVRR